MAPQSAASPKMTTPALPMTPLFYCRILLHTKNVDVCKKLELNPLRFDQDIRVLSWKKNISNIFLFFSLQTKNTVNQWIFYLHVLLNPPYSIYGLTLILGGIKKPKTKQKISVGPGDPSPRIQIPGQKGLWKIMIIFIYYGSCLGCKGSALRI